MERDSELTQSMQTFTHLNGTWACILLLRCSWLRSTMTLVPWSWFKVISVPDSQRMKRTQLGTVSSPFSKVLGVLLEAGIWGQTWHLLSSLLFFLLCQHHWLSQSTASDHFSLLSSSQTNAFYIDGCGEVFLPCTFMPYQEILHKKVFG